MVTSTDLPYNERICLAQQKGKWTDQGAFAIDVDPMSRSAAGR